VKKKVILIFIFLSIIGSSWAQNLDIELARLYARHAWDAYGSSRWQEFSDLVEKGLEYDDLNPDLLSFRGLEARSEGHYEEARKWFSKAFYSGYQAEHVKNRDILAWLFEMNYRLGNDSELESLYYTINEITRDNQDILFYTALSLHRLGRTEDAVKLAEEGVYRYQDQRFLILLSLWSDNSSYPGILSEYIERQGLLYPDLLARAVLSPENKNPSVLASLYLAQENDLNSWYIRKTVLGLPVDDTLIPDFTDSRRIWPLKTLQSYINEHPDMGELMSELTYMSLDSSADGIVDFTILKKGDEIVWELDFNQDGTADTRMIWDNSSVLQSVTYIQDDLIRSFYYYDYPYIERVDISGGRRNFREYYYLPGSFRFSLGDKPEELHVQLLMKNEDNAPVFTEESDILNNCFSLIDSVTEDEKKPFREYTVVDGMIRRFREDSNFDGQFDRTVLLDNWLPYEGYRDIDNDGDYDLKEKYINGRFAGFVYEGGESRLEEYQDLWSRRRYQLWDFSKNGFYDALLEQKGDGSWDEMLIEQ
jgi:hypothetical protein